MGAIKRPPQVSRENASRVHKLSKADWIELYADLYRQAFGEGADERDWIGDAERRNKTLDGYR